MTKQKTDTFKIFNITAFDPIRFTWVIDRYTNNFDLAVAQAAQIKEDDKNLYVYIVGYKNRRDPNSKIVWESDPIRKE